jgi:hypothetical protein
MDERTGDFIKRKDTIKRKCKKRKDAFPEMADTPGWE